MNQNVGEQINSVINNLAGKLGVAADKVYPLLIKQVYVDGFIAIIFILIGLFMCIAPYIGYKIVTKKNKDEEYISKYWEEGWMAFWVVSIFIIVIGIAFVLVNMCTAVNAFGNPEWYAVQQVINQLKDLK